jgi:hypothetical protein
LHPELRELNRTVAKKETVGNISYMISKQCKRCKKMGKWHEDYCGRCLNILRERESRKGVYKEFGSAMNIVGAR